MAQDRSIKKISISHSASFKQLGILVLDGSGSMDEMTVGKISKAESVSNATKDLFSRFKSSRIKNCFSFAIVDYDHRAKVVMEPTEVKDIDEFAEYNPMADLGGATYISEGLKEAKKMAEAFMAQATPGGLSYSVMVLIMTDGVDMTQPETISEAKQLREMPGVKVAGCFFETLDADPKAMQECCDYVKGLCSEERLFSKVADAEDLRKFFIASMSNVAPSML